MNCKDIWEYNLIWLLDCLKDRISSRKEKCAFDTMSENIKSECSNMNFEGYLQKKLLLRNLYLECNEHSFLDVWISKRLLLKDGNVIADEEGDTYYERTTRSGLEKMYTNYFEREFIGDNILTSQYRLVLTNSGMSAILLALHLCRMLSKADSVIVQNEMYYEIDPIIKTIFKNIEYKDSEQVLQDVLEGRCSCFFLGYAKTHMQSNVLSIKKVIDILNKVIVSRPIYIVIDRTYFSLDDMFYEQLVKLSHKDNITIISVESLLKHYQYGLEMTTLGAMFIYSKKCKSSIYNGIISLLYDSLGVRLSPVLYARLFPFNKSVLTDLFLLSCQNAKFLYEYLQNDSIIQIGHEKDGRINTGDLLYLPVANVQQCQNIISYIQKTGKVVHGQSFGFDITRICCEEDVNTHEVKLRISLGTEDEQKISMIGERIINAIKKYCE